jgi:ElaB/YqjD/DUF883 family membrane-anchored ribosome-binding protein
MLDKPGPSDTPKPPPAPVPPADTSAARKAASAVAGQELTKPSQPELLRANLQDKTTQLKQGSALAAERVGGMLKGVSDALERKTGHLADGAKEAPGRIKDAVRTAPEKIKDAVTAAPEKIKDAVTAAPGKIKEEITERPFSAIAKIGLTTVEHVTGTRLPSGYKDDVGAVVKGAEPYLRARADTALQRAGDLADQAKAKVAEVAKTTFEKIQKDERGGTSP